MRPQLTCTEKGVVTKSLMREIREFVESGFASVQVQWDSEVHRISFLQVIDDFLAEKYADGKIATGKVVCDERNNSATAFSEGNFTILVQYREKNALIDTRLEFRVQTK